MFAVCSHGDRSDETYICTTTYYENDTPFVKSFAGPTSEFCASSGDEAVGGGGAARGQVRQRLAG